MPGFFERLRGRKDDEPVDMEAGSPETGLKYKDIALLGEMMKQGADLDRPRHALYCLPRTVRARPAIGGPRLPAWLIHWASFGKPWDAELTYGRDLWQGYAATLLARADVRPALTGPRTPAGPRNPT
jgi:hypothetical protein